MDPLQTRIAKLDGGRILDVATGTGDFLKTLSDAFRGLVEGVGIDPAADRIETAAKDADSRLSFEVMNAEALDYEDGRFDTVVMRHSLHHLRNIDKVLGEMSRVLRTGGLMIIGEVVQDPATERPNSQRHLHHWWGRAAQTRGEPHFETFTHDEVVSLIRPLQLAEEEVFEFFEESNESEQAEFLALMLQHTETEIKKLREAGGQPDLLKEGEELLELFREQGYTDEKVVFVMGRKARES